MVGVAKYSILAIFLFLPAIAMATPFGPDGGNASQSYVNNVFLIVGGATATGAGIAGIRYFNSKYAWGSAASAVKLGGSSAAASQATTEMNNACNVNKLASKTNDAAGIVGAVPGALDSIEVGKDVADEIETNTCREDLKIIAVPAALVHFTVNSYNAVGYDTAVAAGQGTIGLMILSADVNKRLDTTFYNLLGMQQKAYEKEVYYNDLMYSMYSSYAAEEKKGTYQNMSSAHLIKDYSVGLATYVNGGGCSVSPYRSGTITIVNSTIRMPPAPAIAIPYVNYTPVKKAPSISWLNPSNPYTNVTPVKPVKKTTSSSGGGSSSPAPKPAPTYSRPSSGGNVSSGGCNSGGSSGWSSGSGWSSTGWSSL